MKSTADWRRPSWLNSEVSGDQRDQTTPYHLAQQHGVTFFKQAPADSSTGLPQFVKDKFDALLKCGVLANGFLRLRCGDCSHNKLGAFGCKRRGRG